MSSLPQQKTGLLKAFLAVLPGASAGRLAAAVEVDRLMDGQALPHADILEGLRPVLRRDRSDRTPTPLRLFCHPFADLLTSQPRFSKRKGFIARSTLQPMWNWIAQTLLPAETAAYISDVKALVVGHKIDEALARAAQFWPLASDAINTALATPAGRRAAQKALGDELAVEDAAEMALLLSAGEVIEKLSALLPVGIGSFHKQLLWQVREIYDRLVKDKPDVAPYVAVIAMNRLAKPWEALRLPLLITRQTDDTLLSKTDMGLVGEILFAQMDTLRDSIKANRHPQFDADKLMAEVKGFSNLSRYIAIEIELKRDSEWGQRLLAERVEIGRIMEDFMDRAPRAVAAALQICKGGGAEFGKLPGAEKHEIALRYARLVTGSRDFAAAASFSAKQQAIYSKLRDVLGLYGEDLMMELKADARNTIVNTQFEFCTELTAILFSAKEVELLRRRRRAIQSAQA